MTEIDIGVATREFMGFWGRYFPERLRMSRAQAWEAVNDAADGMRNKIHSDQEMIPYQDKVAGVYGAYEDADFQRATMHNILEHVERLLLVDYSPAMLARAEHIARSVGIERGIVADLADAAHSTIRDQVADVVFCINAMHWSKNWRQWIAQCARVAKPNVDVFLTCSLLPSRTDIRIPRLQEALKSKFNIRKQHPLMPPSRVGGYLSQSSRYVMICRRKGK